MPVANQYSVSRKELVELIVKQAGVHEGKWVLTTTFAFTAGNFGPNDDEMMPGAVVAIQNVGIQRAEANSPAGLIVDASEVNPA